MSQRLWEKESPSRLMMVCPSRWKKKFQTELMSGTPCACHLVCLSPCR